MEINFQFKISDKVYGGKVIINEHAEDRIEQIVKAIRLVTHKTFMLIFEKVDKVEKEESRGKANVYCQGVFK